MNNYKGTYKLVIVDWIAAAVSWLIFFILRKQKVYGLTLDQAWEQTQTKDLLVIFLLIPIFWITLYFFSGTYINLYKKSRIRTIFSTFVLSLLGSVLLFFTFVINDPNVDYSYFYQFLYKFFLVHFSLTTLLRLLVLNTAKKELKNGKVSFRSLLVGSNQKALEMLEDIQQNPNLVGYHLVGFATMTQNQENGLKDHLPYMGDVSNISQIVKDNNIEEVYIASDTTQHRQLKDIIIALSNDNVVIKLSADNYDIITGVVKTQNLFMSAYVEISPLVMSDWERLIKRSFDIFAATGALLITSPLFIYAAIKTRLSSPGPILYSQLRMGLQGQQFRIYKFRSMYQDAEKKGPQLSSDDDPRITPWGKVMRKWRIDEIPQFINIIKGDMSWVGPRPERKFFYDQLSQRDSTYPLLLKVRPGITSWGMVKFGYAENLDQMLQRMKYDILYIRNASILLDFKILILTFIVILQGRGK